MLPSAQTQATAWTGALCAFMGLPSCAQEVPSLPGCSAASSCVSTSALNAPSAFLAPWVYEPTPRQNALRCSVGRAHSRKVVAGPPPVSLPVLRELVEELESRGARIVKQDEETGQVVAEIRYGRGQGKSVQPTLCGLRVFMGAMLLGTSLTTLSICPFLACA